MTRVFIAACALIVLVSACTSSHPASKTASAPPGTSPTVPSDTPIPSDSETSPPTSLRVGTAVTITDADGSFDLAVGSPIAIEKPAANPNYWLGVAVVISNIEQSPTFDPIQLGLAPVDGGSSADDGSDSPTVDINKGACGHVPMLHDALRKAGVDPDEVGDYTLSAATARIAGCVTFTYDRPDRPSSVAYYDDVPTGDSSDVVLASWSIKLPRKVTTQPPPMLALKVFGNGSTSLVTYSEGTSIEQDTAAALPWTKRVDPNSDFYQVSAQDQDGTSITCEIIGTDGKTLDKHTSTGAYAIASCSSSG